MFKKRTLFVVGAGASAEFKMEPGPGLAKLIAAKLKVHPSEPFQTPKLGDPDMVRQLMLKDQKRLNPLLEAARVISEGVEYSASIDDFLDNHAKNEDVKAIGKIAIAKTILEQEKQSWLHVDQSNSYNRLRVSHFENSWIIRLVRILGRGIARENVSTIFNNVAFIVFNYDRCIEHTLYFALQQLFNIDRRQAAEVLEKLVIIHPYGCVAELMTETRGNGIPFGGRPNIVNPNYVHLSENIRTYTEQITDAVEVANIHEQIIKAEQIVFLGFAFHDQNIKLLKPHDPLEPKNIFATAYGMSDRDVANVQAQLMLFFNEENSAVVFQSGNFDIRNDLKCAAFFDQFGRSLSG